ncbi:MAG: hypothetical protein WAS55_13250 [Saprospiraceae bacterium]
MKNNNKPIAFVRELMNGRSEEEILEAEDNFREFFLVIKEIANRLEREGIDFSEIPENIE